MPLAHHETDHMKRVVLVDADLVSRAATAAILHTLEFEVETISTGTRALARRRKTRPAACLVAETSQSMTASEFVHACRHHPRFENVPIVVMSVSPRNSIDAIREGAHACIRKPVDEGSVYAALSDVLAPNRQLPR